MIRFLLNLAPLVAAVMLVALFLEREAKRRARRARWAAEIKRLAHAQQLAADGEDERRTHDVK